jgi:AraC-like DNA-binding protein
MAVLVDTSVVAPAERFEFWSDAASRVFYPMGVRRLEERPFGGRVWGYALGPVVVFRVRGDASAIVRTPRSIAQGDPEHVQLALLLRGRFVVRQDGRSVRVAGGEVTMFDSSRPFVVDAPEPFEHVVYSVPRELLGRDADRLARMTADRTEPGPARFLLHDLLHGLESGALAADEPLAERVIDLLRGLQPGGQAPSADLLLASIKAFIEAHLGDPDLGPDSVATAHFISTRYLHRLFERESLTVSEWIRRARLARCRRDLADPRLAERPIGEIARRWGLVAPAHFSRAFRAAYGISPRELRRALPTVER